jgi:hypothetical protein
MEYFIGIGASLLVQVIKRYAGTNTLGSYLVMFFVALLCAALYVTFSDTALFAVFLKVLTVAGAFHNFIIRRFEGLSDAMDEAGVMVE